MKFKEQCFQKFDKRASQYIIEYEEIDNEIDDNIKSINNDKTKALMINVKFLSPFQLDLENVNTNTFITSCKTIQQAKTMTANAVTNAAVPFSLGVY